MRGNGEEPSRTEAGDGSGALVSLNGGSRQVRLLLVDPTAASREQLERTVTPYGFIACRAVEQLGAAMPLGENPDVVLIQAPHNGNGGFSVGQTVVRAATIFPRAAILILNGDADTRLRELALTSGVSGFLSRDALPDSLAAAILLASRGVAVLPRPALDQLRHAARNGSAQVRSERRRLAENEGGMHLTSRQQEVVRLLLEGLSNKEIAHRLGITESTVKVHVRSIMSRAGVMSRTQLVLSVLARAD